MRIEVREVRVRLVYAKRYGACFVPHIALAQVFSRSVLRAGLHPIMTQGFSPRAKISFAPELPAGVVALNEPVDIYLHETDKNIMACLNNALPEGFSISCVTFPEDTSPSIGKLCTHAEYLLRSTNFLPVEQFFSDSLLAVEHIDDWLRIIISSPAQNPIGGLVKFMIHENIISGWHEINIVRVAIGSLINGKVIL